MLNGGVNEMPDKDKVPAIIANLTVEEVVIFCSQHKNMLFRPGNLCWCPVARYMKTIFPKTQVLVGLGYITVDKTKYRCTAKIEKFINAFDSRFHISNFFINNGVKGREIVEWWKERNAKTT